MRTCGVSAFLSSRDLMVSPSDLSCLRGGISDSTIHHINERSNVFVPLKHSKCQVPVQCAVRFRPCIDIHKETLFVIDAFDGGICNKFLTGKVKQIVGSTLRDLKGSESDPVTNFESDKSAAEFAKLYWKDGLTGGHVIMLGADLLSKSAAIEALHAYPGGLQVGGGINSDNALGYLEEGASHIIVTLILLTYWKVETLFQSIAKAFGLLVESKYVFNNGQMDLERLKDLVHTVGKHRLVLDLSCRKRDERYAIVTDRWQKFTDVHLDKETLNFLATYADEFLVHGVDVEGKRLGIDEELVKLLGMHSPIPVTYAGGVTTMADLEKIKEAGMDRVDVTVGSALDIFGGDLAYNDVVSWHHKQGPLVMK
ncbi:hypothetical protein Sjap_009377 [Stephania japonica]|uniref:Phosphoribosylformimino-5-aminoimidazole carboxamide ribotide isomerase n=1 Tax=Stephania japonica TaxID=461633 RepID=A0AAP0JSS7_9MAGN